MVLSLVQTRAQSQGDPYYADEPSYTKTAVTVEQDPQVTGWLSEFDPYSDNIEDVPEYPKVRIKNQTGWQYPYLREADVAWMQRYERIIDTRQKMNILLRYPKLSVFDLMLKLALMPDGPKIYSDRDFKTEMTDKELLAKLMIRQVIDSIDYETGEVVGEQVIYTPPPRESLNKLRMMEDWVFDKKHSRMYPRIVALSMMYTPTIANGQVELAEQPLFWFKYEDIRPYFINAEVFNRNMASRISMDHFFQARLFDSYIVKEPNVFDYDIRYYPEYEDNGLGALLKAEEVQNELFITEHDLWEY